MCYMEAVPDEILENILSRLTWSETVITCNVSRRWRKLGLPLLTRCKNLDLDFTNFRYDKEHMRFVAVSVEQVLNKHHQGEVLDHLGIAFTEEEDHKTGICQSYDAERIAATFERWFTLASAKRVQSLDFDGKSYCPFGLFYNRYRELHCVPPQVATWDRLTSLSLKFVVVNDADVALLLSTSPNLETCVLEGAPILNLELRNPIPKLKRLEIRHCQDLCSISIHSAPSLESFKHAPLPQRVRRQYTNIRVSFQHVPGLGAICLGGPLCRNLVHDLQKWAPQLQKLQLDMDLQCGDEECCKYDRGSFPTLGNLKQLELRFTCTPIGGRRGCHICGTEHDHHHAICQIDTAISIIDACPCLDKLTLKYEGETERASKQMEMTFMVISLMAIRKNVKEVQVVI